MICRVRNQYIEEEQYWKTRHPLCGTTYSVLDITQK